MDLKIKIRYIKKAIRKKQKRVIKKGKREINIMKKKNKTIKLHLIECVVELEKLMNIVILFVHIWKLA